MTPRLSGVIFDLDGTLANTLPLCYAAFRDVLGRATGRRYADPEIRALFGPDEEGVFRRLVPNGWQGCLAAYETFYDVHHDLYVRPIPGVAELLAWLRWKEIRVGVVTGKGWRSAELTLARLDLAQFVESLRAGSPAGPWKPAALREVLDEWGVDAIRVLYVGDAPSDMRAAAAAGVRPGGAAWVDGTDARALRDAGAARVFAAPAALHAWLAGRVGAPGRRSGQRRARPGKMRRSSRQETG